MATGVPITGATVEDVVPVVEAGIYNATFERIEQRSNDAGDFWWWAFAVYDGDEVKEVTATTSPRITPRTKAAKFLTGLGAQIEVGVDVDFGALIGTPCQLVCSVNDGGYTRIDTVLPLPVKNGAKAK